MELTKLNIGVLLDAEKIPSWSYHVLEKVLGNNCISSVDFIVLPGNQEISKSKPLSTALYRYYMALERWKFIPQPSASELQGIDSLLKDNENITLRTLASPLKKNVKMLEECHLDIIINLSTCIIPDTIFQVPKYGIWQYVFSDESGLGGDPPAFWELFKNQDLIGCTLKVYQDDSGRGATLAKSIGSVEPISVIRNHNANLWRCVSLAAREIKKMGRMGPEKYMQKISDDNSQLYSHTTKHDAIPANIKFLKAFCKRLFNYAKFKYRQLVWFEQWVLMYHLGDAPYKDFNAFRYILPPKDRFWADPFCIYENDRYYVFFEEALNTNPEHAHLCALEIDKDGNVGKPQIILKRNYHLSYPFVFKHDNKIWMIPETADNHTIELYICKEFPHNWELHRILINDIVAYDTSLFFHNNKWWLFATVVESPGASTWDEVFLFFSDAPFSTLWTPHPKNPIVSDVRNARPAGKIFTHNSNIYRPAQNSSKRYGYGMNINKIVKLTESDYEEVTIDKLEPNFDPRIVALHTLNYDKNLTIIDVQRKRSIFK